MALLLLYSLIEVIVEELRGSESNFRSSWPSSEKPSLPESLQLVDGTILGTHDVEKPRALPAHPCEWDAVRLRMQAECLASMNVWVVPLWANCTLFGLTLLSAHALLAVPPRRCLGFSWEI